MLCSGDLARTYQDSEARFQCLFDHAPIGLILTAADDRNLMVNRAFCQMVGYDRALLERLTFKAITHPEDKDRADPYRQQLLARQIEQYSLEKRYIRSDGSVLWVQVTSALVPERGDRAPYFIAQVEDIDARRQIETTLRFLAGHRWIDQGEHFLPALTQYLAPLLEVEYVFIGCLEPGRDAIRTLGFYAQGEMLPSLHYELAGTPCENVVGRTFCLYAEGARELFTQDRFLQERGIESYAGIPLWTTDGQPLGLLGTMSRRPMRNPDRIQSQLQLVALRVSAEIEHLEARAERDQTLRSLQRESEKNRILLRSASDGIHILDEAGNLVEASDSFCAMLGYEHGKLIGQNVSLWDARWGRDEVMGVVREDFAIGEGGRRIFETEHRCFDGTVFPVEITTHVCRQDGRLLLFCSSRDIRERKQAAAITEYLAYHDPLTDLPNRRLFRDRLDQAQRGSARSAHYGAVMMIDLDNFKSLNDTLGHEKGDRMLQLVALRLVDSLRSGDTVARLGGDEFVVLLLDLGSEDLKAAEEAELIGNKLLDKLRKPHWLGPHRYRITPSIGVTLFDGQRQHFEELIKQADLAMYEAKKAGKDTLRFFDQGVQDALAIRVKFEHDLHGALTDHQFVLHFQIQVDADRSPRGAEVLIRWRHPERGLVMPDDFIPLAEETGLILPIGDWVLEQSCRQLAQWKDQPRFQDLPLAVNVSPRQLRQPHFVERVRQILKHHDIAPQLLKLEITEGTLLTDSDQMLEVVQGLRALGVTLSLDDFGTGYSSLSYLKRIPLGQLKIGRSFVDDIATAGHEQNIIHTIIAMARSFRIDVIAEGVEEPLQYDFLVRSGCAHFQGFLFGEPLPIEAFEAQVLTMVA